ncbi:MAG TPA: glycosyltransferase, partial [Gemmatimonadales bacterium]|nr:glycosyltransferase [Gemmatimonadales bacterium]
MTPTDTASGGLAPAARLTVAVIAACPFPARRGTPVRIQRLAEELTQRGHRVVVVTYHHGTGDPDPSVEVRRIRPIRSYNKLGPGPSYRKLLLLDPMLMVKLAGILRRERV